MSLVMNGNGIFYSTNDNEYVEKAVRGYTMGGLFNILVFARARPCTNVNGLPLQWGKKISSLEKFCRRVPID